MSGDPARQGVKFTLTISVFYRLVAKFHAAMAKIFFRAGLFAAFAVVALFFGAGAAAGQGNAAWDPNVSPLPPPTGFVNDYVGVIDPATKQALEEKLKAFRDRTGVEIGVAIVKTTGDRDIFDYSLAVARGWKIGSKADDNPGALLLVAIEDRKYFTQISRDLEDELPDGLAGSIQRQYLVPEFRKGNYAKGISDTIDAYIRTIESRSDPRSTPAATPATADNGDTEAFGVACCCIGLVLILIIWGLASNNRRGGGSGEFASNVGTAVAAGVISSILSSSSSSSSSGSDWGGGGDWGGFGGGGDFGGGGAGGDW